MLTPRLAYLFARYWDREATPAEREELMALLKTNEHDEDFKALVDEAMQRTEIMDMDEESATLILQSILNADKKQAPLVPMFRKRMIRFAAAASLVGVIAAGYFLFFNKKQPAGGNLVKNTTQDIAAPTNNRASITLANGSHVFLDSAANGTLARQGNTQIVKLADGKLAYNGKEQPQTAIEYNTLNNPRGSKVITLTLSDGTQVWLNVESSIKYPVAFNGKSRTVEISGEAYFEVAKDRSKPFHVKTNDMEVEVLGTHFNINSYSDEESIKTTLLEGSVKMSKQANSILLEPGEQGILNSTGTITKTANVDIDKIMSWKNGWFEFEQTDLATIMRQVGRWYDVDISYEGKPSTDKFGGRVSKNVPLSDILKSLEANSKGVRFRLEGKKLIVQP